LRIRPSGMNFFGFRNSIFYIARLSALLPTPNVEDQVSIFISLSDRVALLYPQALSSLFIAYYDLAGLLWRYCNPPPHGEYSQYLVLIQEIRSALIVQLPTLCASRKVHFMLI
jgi:hypothetical protein